MVNIAANEAAMDPNGGLVASDPYGVLAEPGSRLVVDAGPKRVECRNSRRVLRRRSAVYGRRGTYLPCAKVCWFSRRAIPRAVGTVLLGVVTRGATYQCGARTSCGTVYVVVCGAAVRDPQKAARPCRWNP